MGQSRELRAALSRRSFLRYTALSAGLLTLARLRPPPAAATVPEAAGLQVLTRQQGELFAAIAERMVDCGDQAMPALRDTRAVEVVDHLLLHADASVRVQLRLLLTVFEWGPPLFQLRFKRFTRLSPQERDAYIEDWAASRIEQRRVAFFALKNLSMLGYYSQDETWKGIHYDGPWVPQPRRYLRER